MSDTDFRAPCVELDTLVDVERAFGGDVQAGLEHLMACSRCRDRLDSIHDLARELRRTEPLEHGFTERVAHRLDEGEMSRRTWTGSGIPPLLIRLLNAGLVVVSVVLFLALSAAWSSSEIGLGTTVGIALFCGLLYLLWSVRVARTPTLAAMR